MDNNNVLNGNEEPTNTENMFAKLANVEGLDNLQYIGSYENEDEKPKTR